MKYFNSLNAKIIISIFIIIFFFVLHLLIQQKVVYDKVFSHLFLNYSANKERVVIPYAKINNTNLLNWDCGNYNSIKEHMYDSQYNGDHIFSSFPFFPIVWKLSHLSPLGISILNIIFYIISVCLLSALFEVKNIGKFLSISIFVLLLTFPGSSVFYIPYSESLFMMLITIAIGGLFKNRYWLFFIGMCLAAMTRSVSVVFFATFFAAEFLLFIKNKNVKSFLFNFLLKTLPIFIGTLAASLIQLYNGSGSLLKFIEVQKYWDYKLQMPKLVTDWSQEGYGSDIGAIFFIVVPAIFYMIFVLFSNSQKSIINEDENINKHKNYFFNFSLIYSIAMFLFILLFKGGNLYGTTRYIISTPFFFIIMIEGISKINSIPKVFQYSFFVALFLLSYFFISMANFSIEWNFSKLGYVLFVINFGFIIFYKNNYWFKFLFMVIVFFNILWATYMYNMELTNSWICF